MYIAGLLLAVIILVVVGIFYPFYPNPSRPNPHTHLPNHDRPLDGDDGNVKKEDFVLPETESALPHINPMTDITQPLLNPVMPSQIENPLPKIPKWSTDPRVILDHPSLLVEYPPRSHLAPLQPHRDFKQGKFGSPTGTHFGEVEVRVMLPTVRNLCWKYGEIRSPTFHLKGNSSIHGYNLVQAAVDPNGDVIPHVFIISWNKFSGEVILRNDYTGWRGNITLGYYLECNYPEDFEDIRNVVKQMSLDIKI